MRGLDKAKTRGPTAVDVPLVRSDEENALVKNGRLDAVDRSDSFGFGVRAIADGAWGFAASQVVTADEVDRVAALAFEIAKASSITKKRDAMLAPVDPVRATYETPVDFDPLAMSFDDRVKLLMNAEARMRETKGLRTTRATYAVWREDKLFVSREGQRRGRRRHRGGGGREWRAADPHVPRRAPLPERRWVGDPHALGSHRERRARGRGGRRAAVREAVPAGPDHDSDPQRESAVAAGSRELRPPARAPCRARE